MPLVFVLEAGAFCGGVSDKKKRTSIFRKKYKQENTEDEYTITVADPEHGIEVYKKEEFLSDWLVIRAVILNVFLLFALPVEALKLTSVAITESPTYIISGGISHTSVTRGTVPKSV